MDASSSKHYDIAIIGGGILGVALAFWLSELYECSIVLVEKESEVAKHTSSRNTGMIHRPFYLNPEKKRIFARATQKSYFFWKELAGRYNLTWKPIGTLEVATGEGQIKTLDQYKKWAFQNGMQEDEIEVLDGSKVNELEPKVKCLGAIHSKTDTCVNYSEFTHFLFELALKNGIQFLGGFNLEKIEQNRDRNQIYLRRKGNNQFLQISADFLINAAGGGSVDIAHGLGLAKEYTDLHFRGEYWRVDEPFASKVTRNIYSVARYKEYPFLDPHLIIRASGLREIGPNAVLVASPWAYKGLSETKSQLISKIFESPFLPKLKLFTSRMFLSLVFHEWRSSISKKAMCGRVKEFIPSLDVSYLGERGMSGVRSSVIDNSGFVSEAILLEEERSMHILNYNSPGASGAPAFSAYVISKILDSGKFGGINRRDQSTSQKIWNFEDASDL